MKLHHISRTRRILQVAAVGGAVGLAPSAAWSQFGTPFALTPAGQTAFRQNVTTDSGR